MMLFDTLSKWLGFHHRFREVRVTRIVQTIVLQNNENYIIIYNGIMDVFYIRAFAGRDDVFATSPHCKW